MNLGQTLVLNCSYEPIGICDVEHAFCLIYLKKAELIEASDKPLRSTTEEFMRPSVIRMYTYNKHQRKKVALSKKNVQRRDSYKCQYCGASQKLTIDHVIPSSRGGTDDWTNWVTACKRCNNLKDDRTPEECGMKLKGKPTRPNHINFFKAISKEIDKSWEQYLFI